MCPRVMRLKQFGSHEVDERRRVPSAARVDAPIFVELANVNFPALRDASRGFAIRDSLADRLADLAAALERNSGKASFAIDP